MPIPAIHGITYVPNDFREVGDNDDTTLEKFFGFAASGESKGHLMEAIGSFKVTRQVQIRGVGRRLPFAMDIWDEARQDDVVLIKDCNEADMPGKLRVFGTRWSIARLGVGGDSVNGVRLESNRNATLPDFYGRGFSGWACYHGHSDSNNSNMFRMGNVTALNCGANARNDREYFVTVESYTNDEHNNHRQRTHLQLTPDSRMPSAAHHLHRSLLYTTDENGKKKAHTVISADYENKRLEVYPRIPDSYQVPGANFGLAFGGGLCLNVSGDTAKAEFGLVVATRSGPALWLSEQYTPTGKGVVSQYCATSLVLGDRPQNAFAGTKIDCLYAEGEPIADAIIICQAENAGDTNASMVLSTMGFEIDRVQTMNWLRPNGVEGKRDKYIPLIFPQNDKLFTPPYNRNVIRGPQEDEGSYTVFSSPLSNNATYAYVVRKDSQIYLNDNAGTRDIRGVEPTHFTLYGDGENGQYRKNFGIACKDGYTINGKAGKIYLPRYEVPVTIHCLLAQGNNWIVTVTKHELI